MLEKVKSRSWLTWERTKDAIAVLTPIAVAVLGGVQWYLDRRQNELNQQLDAQKASLEQRVSRTKLIDDMLTNIEQYLDKSTLTNPAKARIIISLLKISTDAYLAEEGELDNKQEEFIRKVPLYFALLSSNDDMLADIGAEENEIALWVPFARRTGDQDIKITALNALNQIIATSDSSAIRKEVSRSLLGMEIAPDNPELRASLLDSVVGAIARIEIDEAQDDPELTTLAERLKALEDDLRLREAGSPPAGRQPGQPEIAVPDGGTDDEGPPDDDEVSERAANVIANLLPSPPPDEIGERLKTLIDQLDGEQRRAARSELARIGAPAIPALIAALTAPNSYYRTQLGAVAALALMAPSSVKLPPEGTEAVVRLLGHPDATMRTTAATLLSRLVDPATLSRAKDLLLEQLEAPKDGNLVYNSVTVLGGWLQRSDLDPTFRSEVRAGLGEARHRLESMEGWQKTLSLLEGYLSRG